MSLANQSQQWYPTSVKVTVIQARNLRIKGRNGTNDAYAIMQVAKDRFSTIVTEKTVNPVWKEEATFDLPLFHHGNAERCTLCVQVMHRVQMGLDKMLGQVIVNLLDLEEDKDRNKTEWFKLLNKAGKQDKERGEVQLEIVFLRNNMTASMFDLSSQDKQRSRLGKLKDKLRGKKKESMSDSASAIVPSVTQNLTDSEEEGDTHPDTPSGDKKSKLKSLFTPKSNLHRNVSQSMSTLGYPSEWDTPSGGSEAPSVQVELPEGKKFAFLTHKPTGSSDKKTTQGTLSLLGQPKSGAEEQIKICINGSHVYTDQPESRPAHTGSALGLSGSMEDMHGGRIRKEKLKQEEQDKNRQEKVKQEHGEQERKRQEEEERIRLEKLKEKEQEKDRKEEEERMREKITQERKRKEEEEKLRQEKIRLEEEERKRKEEEERIRLEEQRRKEEERIRQEMQDRKMKEEQQKLREEKIRKEEQNRKEAEERIRKDKIRQEEQERKRKEEQEKLSQEKIREGEKMRQDEQERKRKEEQQKLRQEKIRLEEQERQRKEEEERITQEKLRWEEQERKREEQEKLNREKIRQEEEERMRQEKMREEEQERKRKEEEQRRKEEERIRQEMQDRKMKEEQQKLREEKIRKEEQNRKEGEERIRKDKIRQEEQERKRKEEQEKLSQEKIREGEKMRQDEQERKRKEEEQKLRQEKIRLEEQERQRKEEEERITQEKLRWEEQERKREEQEKLNREKIRQEKEERMRQEKMREEEQERKRQEEEEKIRQEAQRKENEEEKRIRKEKIRLEEQEQENQEEHERLKQKQKEKVRQEEKRQLERMREEEKKILSRKEDQSYLEEPKQRVKDIACNPFFEAQGSNPFEENSLETLPDDSNTGHMKVFAVKPSTTTLQSDLLANLSGSQCPPKPKAGLSESSVRHTDKKRRAPLPPLTGSHIPSLQALPGTLDLTFHHGGDCSKKAEIKNFHEGKRSAPQPPGCAPLRQNMQQEDKVNSIGISLQKSNIYFPIEYILKDVNMKENSADVAQKEVGLFDDPLITESDRLEVENSKKPLLKGKLEEPRKCIGVLLIPEISSDQPQELFPGKDLLNKDWKEKSEEDLTDERLASCDASARDGSDQFRMLENMASHEQKPSEMPKAMDTTADDCTSVLQDVLKKKRRAPQPLSLLQSESTKVKDHEITLAGTGNLVRKGMQEDKHDFGASSKFSLAKQTVGTFLSFSSPTSFLLTSPEPVKTDIDKEEHVPWPLSITSSDGRTLLHANVPSSMETQQITENRDDDITLVSKPCRPHPVKPLNASENQSLARRVALKPLEVLAGIPGKTKEMETRGNGPYSQLTQPELISMVVKQEAQIAEKNKKIQDLEDYIDNLLVRVMEEKPSILMAMNSPKKS
ncbi:titin homolog isoform X1 [Scleropages formosus]|uniref:Rab11 family-interacting protein 1-like n=1 Tax=Scleropages formosus TaxID=113540 RepID=A0A8C9UZE0_SCLFO|nr:titin homolog isoform X1 [Scleropages formosus]